MTKFVTVRDMKDQVMTKVNWDRAKKLVKRGVAEKIRWWPNKNMVIKMLVPSMVISPDLTVKGIESNNHPVLVYVKEESKIEQSESTENK